MTTNHITGKKTAAVAAASMFLAVLCAGVVAMPFAALAGGNSTPPSYGGGSVTGSYPSTGTVYTTSSRPSTTYTTSSRPSTSYTTSSKPNTSYTTSSRPGTSYTTSSKPNTSYTTSSKPSTYYTTSSKPSTVYTTSSKPYVNYGSSYKTPTNYGDSYVYKDTYYPTTVTSYGSSCGYYYDCGTSGSSGLSLNLNYNDNDNDNSNHNVNNNVITIGGGTTTESDACKNIPGNQPEDYPCYPQTHDECSNIPGNQPDGYDCYPDNNRDDVSCELDASDTTVDEGDRVTLEWDTDGDVTYASINQGIGRVDEDGGSERVDIDEDTTFRLTVRNSDGDEDTCSVTVRVDDNNNNFSSVAFTGEPTNNPPVVYLSDIPYTGLEDVNPVLLSYWLMLVAAAGAGVWFLYRKGMIPAFAFASAEPIDEGHMEEAVEEGHVEASPEVLSFLSMLQDGDTDGAVDQVREAAANGTGVEEFLADAEVAATDADLQAKVSAALEASKQTGIRGVKQAFA